MIIKEEILVVNVISFVLILFLLNYRRSVDKSFHIENKIFDSMACITLAGSAAETASFLIDGNPSEGMEILNYILNSFSFLGTVSIGLLWCIFVDLHVNKSVHGVEKRAKLIALPWVIEIIAIIYNLFGTNFLFVITEENVYQRGPYVWLGYLTLVFYFICSVVLVARAKKQELYLSFFPVQYFIVPCLVGVITQFTWYGISTSWISVAIAMIFIQMQADTQNIMTDNLSGLYNRKYLELVLESDDRARLISLYGLMLDINDLKTINDSYGHAMGDKAISTVGRILFRSMPKGGMPIRYAGDEFIVLLPGVSQQVADGTVAAIKNGVASFNELRRVPFNLSLSIGLTNFREDDTPDTFLSRMDAKMYEEKQIYHKKKGYTK